MLDPRGVDLIDISGGTYFPAAAPSAHRPSSGPNSIDFARKARRVAGTALMLTGGIKRRAEAEALIATGIVDVVGLARALVLDPDLPNRWTIGDGKDPVFPRFVSPPPGGVTAWYTMQLTALADGGPFDDWTPASALGAYQERDAERALRWRRRFALC